jgi:hypothetical protein
MVKEGLEHGLRDAAPGTRGDVLSSSVEDMKGK